MNRITRCPSCTTVYQLGDAHLQAAKGWLRVLATVSLQEAQSTASQKPFVVDLDVPKAVTGVISIADS